VNRERGNGTATDRFAGLLSWWGMTDPAQAGPYEARLKRLQKFVAELQGAYGEAYGRQMEAMFSANEHFARAAQDLMRSRKPSDVVAAESALMSALMEEAAAQAQAWSELVQKLTDCCTAAATETRRSAAAPSARSAAGAGAARGKHLQPV
jgi:hypothetical protein